MIMLVCAAVVTAFVLPQVEVNKGNLSAAAQIVLTAYPIADSVLLSVALAGVAVAGRRAGALWWLFATGIFVLVGGDILWALHAAAGTWQPVMSSNAVYPLWTGLVAVAAWLPRRQSHGTVGAAGIRRHAAVLVARRGGRLPAHSQRVGRGSRRLHRPGRRRDARRRPSHRPRRWPPACATP